MRAWRASVRLFTHAWNVWEKTSGAQPERRELLRLLKAVATGDVVTVTRGRLARSTFDLFAVIKRIVDAGAQFRSLAVPWADRSTSTGRLMIAVLGGLAPVRKLAGSASTVHRSSRLSSSVRHGGGAPRVRRLKSWRRATAWRGRRFQRQGV